MGSTCERYGGLLRDMLDRVGGKWSLLVVSLLAEGPQRFGQLHKSMPGISQRMLAQTLRQFERDGLVTRTVHAEVPPRVEYELTDMGRPLVAPVLALVEWVVRYGDEVAAQREAYDAR